MAQLLVDATLAFLRRHPPFNAMDEAALQFLVAHLRLAYFEPDATIVTPDTGVPRHLHIIQRGRVLSRRAELAPQIDHLTLGEGECFPIGAVSAQRPSSNRYTALGDVFCYQIDGADFAALMGMSAEFRLFFTRHVATLLMQSRRQLQTEFAQRAAEQQTLATPLAQVLRRVPVAVGAGASLREALERMAAEHLGSIVVCNAEQRPVGIMTRDDLLERVVLAGRALDRPVTEVMTAEPECLPLDASGYDAAMVMATHCIRHVLVVDADRRLAGVVSERDLFAIQRLGLSQVRQAIDTAPDVERLNLAATDVRRLALNLLAQGVGAEQLTHFVSALNDAVTRRVIALALRQHDLSGIDWVWLAFGSEGREEQTFATDQDNGIAFIARSDADREAQRARLLAFADTVNRDLDRCGFALCKGNIMARNPRCCLTLDEWLERFDGWVRVPDPIALLNAAIHFDFRALAGDAELAHRLRRSLHGMTANAQQFVAMLANLALDTMPPLGRLQDFVVGHDPQHPTSIDLKKLGARVFVDAARAYALARGFDATNTAQRLRLLARDGGDAENDVAALVSAFQFIQMLRLRTQCRALEAGQAGGNHVDPARLDAVERRVLKESFKQARRLQQRLRLEFLS